MFAQNSEGMNERLTAAWTSLREEAPIGTIRSKRQHAELLNVYDVISAEVGENRMHPLADLLDWVVRLINEYESEHTILGEAEPREALRFLMEQNGLKQSDLAKEIGTQSLVSEILRGKREINVRQAKALGKRFRVSPLIFL